MENTQETELDFSAKLPCAAQSLGCVWIFVTPWAVARQAPPSMEFSRQEFWSGCPFLLQGIFPIQGLNMHLLHLLHWQEDSLALVPPGKPRIL